MVGSMVGESPDERARPWFVAKTAPIAGAVLLAAGTAFVVANDPSSAGSRFPACTFRTWTGLWCPGCGLTRATHELLHGHVGTALGYNLFVPVAAVGIVLAWWAWFSTAWAVTFMPQRVVDAIGVPGSRRRRRADRALWILFAIVIGYGVLRNIPMDPFTTLAP